MRFLIPGSLLIAGGKNVDFLLKCSNFVVIMFDFVLKMLDFAGVAGTAVSLWCRPSSDAVPAPAPAARCARAARAPVILTVTVHTIKRNHTASHSLALVFSHGSAFEDRDVNEQPQPDQCGLDTIIGALPIQEFKNSRNWVQLSQLECN